MDNDSIAQLLRSNNISKTKIKIKIISLLSSASYPLSVVEIHGMLSHECNLSTVFRAITQFKEHKIIREINLDEGFLRFEMFEDTAKNHHHHIRCKKCGGIKNLNNCNLKSFEKAIAKLGFTETEHRLEFFGLCLNCQKTN